jgi:hypothetical protein
MKRNVKIIIAISAFLALVVLYGYTKAKTLIDVFEKVTITPVDFSNIDISLNRIGFNVNVLFENPTNEDFNVSGFGIAILKTVNFYYNGIFIASSTINLSQINVPQNNSIVVSNIPVEVPLSVILQNAAIIQNFNTNLVSASAIVSVAGNDFLIDNK